MGMGEDSALRIVNDHYPRMRSTAPSFLPYYTCIRRLRRTKLLSTANVSALSRAS